MSVLFLLYVNVFIIVFFKFPSHWLYWFYPYFAFIISANWAPSFFKFLINKVELDWIGPLYLPPLYLKDFDFILNHLTVSDTIKRRKKRGMEKKRFIKTLKQAGRTTEASFFPSWFYSSILPTVYLPPEQLSDASVRWTERRTQRKIITLCLNQLVCS